MSKQNNLTDFLTGVADAIRAKKGTTALINPQNFESEIASISGGGGSELNIHYGDTAPEDTSKLWVKTVEPESVEISPDFGYGEAVQTTGIKSGFPTSNITCEDGDYLYVLVSYTVKKYNKKTLEFISNVATLSTNSVRSILIYEEVLYFTKSKSKDINSYWFKNAIGLSAYDLKTKTETELIDFSSHDTGHIKLYNNKIYLIGGGYSESYNRDWSYHDATEIDIYDISLKIRESIPFPYSYQYCGSIVIGNEAFVFGGYKNGSENTIYNVISRVNLDTKTVTKCNAVLPIATYNMGVSNLGNYIYLSCGYKTSQIVYRYDTVNDTIEQVNVTLEHARTACATFFNGTELYLLGSNAIVDKLQIDVPLSSTKLKIISDWLNNQFAVINGSSKVMIGVNKAFKGDENNKAKEVTAYVHDGVNWHNLDGEITLTKLYAPQISISGKTLTITNDGRNGSHVTNYKVYNGSTLLTTITATTLDLTTVITVYGTYNISVIATGTGYTDSDSSNVVEYICVAPQLPAPINLTVDGTIISWDAVENAESYDVYADDTALLGNTTGIMSQTITATLKNVTAASGNATTIATGETKVLTYTANSGYTLPDSVTVTGATGVWNKDAGTLTLSNPTDNVTFTIAGVEVAAGYNVTVSGDGSNHGFDIYDGQSASGTKLGAINGSESLNVVCTSGYLYFYTNDAGGIISVTGGVTEVDWKTVKVTGDGTVTASYSCLIEGTQITLADGTTKAIEDITYDDELLVWNFYDGKFDKAKPSWIKVVETAPKYNLVKFSNGSEVGFVGPGGDIGYHRVFNKEAKAFTHTGVKDTPNGTTTFAQDETFPTVVSQEVVEKEVKFYNVITENHYNLFANGILTSCRLSNKYRIEDMKYVGERLITDKQIEDYFDKIQNKKQ